MSSVSATFQLVTFFERIAKAVEKEKYNSLSHAAASIRKAEIESIQRAKGPSEPGTPPHTHFKGRGRTKKGKPRMGRLPAAILYDVEGERAVIGPRESVVGTSASAHEFGGEYKGQVFPQRPFARPALEKNLDRFAADWQYSLGE